MNKEKFLIFLCGIVVGVLSYTGYLYYIDMMTKPDLKRNWEKVHVGMNVEKVKKLIGNPEFMDHADAIFVGTVMWSYGDGYYLFMLEKEVARKMVLKKEVAGKKP